MKLRTVGMAYVANEPSTQASRPPHQLLSTFELKSTMPRPQHPLPRSSEADIQPSISSINRRQIGTVRAAAQVFNVPRTTLRDRRAGRPA
jgi:hypothetical protein